MIDQWRVDLNISVAGLPWHTRQSCRLATSQTTEGNRKAIALVKAFLNDKISPPLLMLVGVPGVGKTHLAMTVAWEYLEDFYTVLYFQVEDMLNELQSHLDNGKEYGRFWKRLQNCDLLILDDIGAHNPTPWRTSQLDALIDYRYREKAPLIMTANKLDLSERILDRMKDGATAVMTGESWRGKKKL